MEWIYQNEKVTDEIMEGFVGFVYLIENIQSGRKYVGKKLTTKSKTYQKNKKKKRKRVPSNWRDYFGSSESLQNDVKEFGENNFRRTILRLCKSKAEMSYYEAREQFVHDVLLHDDWYNDWISVRIRKSHLRSLTDHQRN